MSSSNHISQWLLLGFLAVALLKADPSHAQLPSLQVVDSIETNFSKDYLPIPIDLYHASIGSYFKHPLQDRIYLFRHTSSVLDSITSFRTEANRRLNRWVSLSAPECRSVNREKGGLVYLQRHLYYADTTGFFSHQMKFRPHISPFNIVGDNLLPLPNERMYWDETEQLVFLANPNEESGLIGRPYDRHFKGTQFASQPLISKWAVTSDSSGEGLIKVEKLTSMIHYPSFFKDGQYNYFSDFYFDVDYQRKLIWVSYAALDTIWAYDYAGNRVDSIAAQVDEQPQSISAVVIERRKNIEELRNEYTRLYEVQNYYANTWVVGDYLYRLCYLGSESNLYRGDEQTDGSLRSIGEKPQVLQRIHIPTHTIKAWLVPKELRPYGFSDGLILAQLKYEYERPGNLTIYVLDDAD